VSAATPGAAEAPTGPDDLRETVDYVAITRLQHAYADVVTRRAWDELPGLFRPDATVTVDTVTSPVRELTDPQQLAEFIAAATRRFGFFEFVILNSVVTIVDDETATARTFMCEIRQEVESEQRSQAFGLYRDDYRKDTLGWRFARRRYQSLYRTSGGEVFTLPVD
jgi:hypothetical protein